MDDITRPGLRRLTVPTNKPLNFTAGCSFTAGWSRLVFLYWYYQYCLVPAGANRGHSQGLGRAPSELIQGIVLSSPVTNVNSTLLSAGGQKLGWRGEAIKSQWLCGPRHHFRALQCATEH